MKRNSIIVISFLIISVSLISYPAYGQELICYNGTILHIFQLDYVIRCLDDRVTFIENNPPESEPFPLDDLTDVDTTGVISGRVLKFNGSFWIDDTDLTGSGCTDLNCLTDVVILNPAVNQFIFYNGSIWTNDYTKISRLNDVSVSNPQDGDILKFDDFVGVWFNVPDTTTTCSNVGTGKQVYKDGNCNFRTLTNSSRILINQNTNDLYIDAYSIGQQNAGVYQSVVKTNIGTTYIDIYAVAFDQENSLGIVDCSNATQIFVVWQWDYVGTGTQNIRWVDATNNANVLFETAGFTADQDANSSGFINKPSWCTGRVQIEQQGKSTVGTDDPIAKGYKIMVR